MKVIIIGAGKVGSYIAKSLVESKCDVCVVDNRARVIEKIKSEVENIEIVYGNGSDSTILEDAGIHNCDVLIAVAGKDEVNLMVSTIAKYEYGVNRVIARINNPRNEWLFDGKMGVDTAINQADMLARVAVDELDLDSISTILKVNRGNNSIIQIHVAPGSKGAGMAVKDLALPNDTVLISVLRDSETIIVNGNTVIEANDVIIALTNTIGQYELNAIFTK